MTHSTNSLLGFAALFALTAACSSAQVRPESVSRAAVECDGGDVRSARDANKYYACDRILGDLTVEGTDLSDLAAFGNVKTVTGSLRIAHNAKLESLSKLHQLRAVKSVELDDNAKLTDARGLEGLKRVERLVLRRNGFYRTAGLEGLKSVGELIVTENPNLVSLSGLNHLARAASVEITDNRRLCAQLGLLPALTDVPGDLVVARNLGVSASDVDALNERARSASAELFRSDG